MDRDDPYTDADLEWFELMEQIDREHEAEFGGQE